MIHLNVEGFVLAEDHPVPWAGITPSPVQAGASRGWSQQLLGCFPCWLSSVPMVCVLQGPRGAPAAGAAPAGAARCSQSLLCPGQQLHLRGDVCCHPGGNSSPWDGDPHRAPSIWNPPKCLSTSDLRISKLLKTKLKYFLLQVLAIKVFFPWTESFLCFLYLFLKDRM